MAEDLKTEFRKALWTIVAVAVIGVASSFITGMMVDARMTNQIEIIQQEQKLIRLKLDAMQIQIEKKVDRGTLDNCLNRIDIKLDKIADNIFKMQQDHIK